MNQLDQDEKLIIEVQQYPGLYDQNSYDYRDLRKKERMWQNVSDSLGLHAKECQARWRVLRDKFVREMRKNMNPKRAGSTALQVYQGNWPLMSQLMFLTSHVKHKPVRMTNKREVYSDTGGTDEEEELDQPSEEEEDSVDVKPDPTSYLLTDASTQLPQGVLPQQQQQHHQQQQQQTLQNNPQQTTISLPPAPTCNGLPPPPPTCETPPAGNKRLKCETDLLTRLGSTASSELEILRMVMNFQSTRQEDEENEERLFCLSLVPSLKRLPLERRSLAKLQIQKILHCMEFPDLKIDI